MTLLDLYKKIKSICGCLNSADVPLKCNGSDFNADFEIESKDAIVDHIEVKQDTTLSWQDVAMIITIYEEAINSGEIRRYNDAGFMKEYSQYILKCFNKQRKK